MPFTHDTAAATATTPVPIILDTDLSTDCDDVAALALALQLERRGEATLIGVVHNADLGEGVGGVSSINHYFARDDVPIGAYTTGHIGHADFGPHPYVDLLVSSVPGPIHNSSQTLSALEVYKTALNAAVDHSVTIASIGFATNLHALLADADGASLVARKVRRLVTMGG